MNPRDIYDTERSFLFLFSLIFLLGIKEGFPPDPNTPPPPIHTQGCSSLPPTAGTLHWGCPTLGPMGMWGHVSGAQDTEQRGRITSHITAVLILFIHLWVMPHPPQLLKPPSSHVWQEDRASKGSAGGSASPLCCHCPEDPHVPTGQHVGGDPPPPSSARSLWGCGVKAES